MFSKLHVSIISIVNISQVDLRWMIKFIVMIKILKKKIKEINRKFENLCKGKGIK